MLHDSLRTSTINLKRSGFYHDESVAPNQAEATDPRLSVRILRNFDEIEEIRDVWSSWNRHPNSDIDFYRMIVTSKPDILQPYVLLLCREDLPDALLIGRIEETYFESRVGYKSLHRTPVRQLTMIHGGAIGNLSGENCEVLIWKVIDSLRRKEADVAFFNHVEVNSPLHRALKEVPGFYSRDYSHTPVRHWSMRLPTSLEELNRKIPGDTRREVRRRTKTLQSDHGADVRIECLSKPSDLDRIVRDVEQVARKTYQRGLRVGFFGDPERQQQLEMEAQKGWLRTYILYVAGVPCAFWIGSVYNDVFYSGDVGYDQAFKKYALGTLVLMKLLEDLCSQKVKEMDFGLGDAEWKQRFGNRQRFEVPVYLFAPTVRGLCLNAIHSPVVFTDHILKLILARTNLLQWVKKFWRDRVRRNIK